MLCKGANNSKRGAQHVGALRAGKAPGQGLFHGAVGLLTALTQEVNCFPDDGWFQSQLRIFGRWPQADNYTPIAAPAFFYAMNHRAATLLSLTLAQEFYLGSLL